MYTQNFQYAAADWLRACQLTLTIQKFEIEGRN